MRDEDHKINSALRTPKTEKYKRGPYYRGVLSWNVLSSAVQTSKDKESFKRVIKEGLIRCNPLIVLSYQYTSNFVLVYVQSLYIIIL